MNVFNCIRRDRASGLGKNVQRAKNRADDVAANPSVSFLHPFEWQSMFWISDLGIRVNHISDVANFDGLRI